MRSYRRFLEGLLAEVRDALQEAENMGWHHGGGDAESHYLRLLTWASELQERKEYYDATKAATRTRVRDGTRD